MCNVVDVYFSIFYKLLNYYKYSQSEFDLKGECEIHLWQIAIITVFLVKHYWTDTMISLFGSERDYTRWCTEDTATVRMYFQKYIHGDGLPGMYSNSLSKDSFMIQP